MCENVRHKSDHYDAEAHPICIWFEITEENEGEEARVN